VLRGATRTLVVSLLVVASPAAAQTSQEQFEDAGAVGIDIMEMTVSGRGGVDPSIMPEVLRNQQKISSCYKEQLQNKPRLAGTVHARFTINADGKVVTSTATSVDGTVARCIAEAIQKIEFCTRRSPAW